MSFIYVPSDKATTTSLSHCFDEMAYVNKLKPISAKFDDNILNKIVEDVYGKSVQIVNVDVNLNSSKGDAFLSIVYRITITCKDEKNLGETKEVLHIICKGFPSNLARRKTFRSIDFFSNEINFYNKVWPSIKEFQKSRNVETFTNIPNYYYGLTDGLNDFIVLEDLSFKGFEGIKRSTGLDLLHCTIIIKLFAKFHGTSLALKLQQPQRFESIANNLQETYFADKFRNWYVPFQKNNLKIARDCIEKELSKKYVEKFDQLTSGDFYGKICALIENKGKFAVITHGDTWIPNFLIKYNNNSEPLEVMLIDFQLARYASFATDILFFMYACTVQELRDEKWDYLIEEYYKEFSKTLEKLGCEPGIISLSAIHDELKKYALFGVGMAIEAVTMSIIDDDDFADINELEGDDAHPLEEVWVLHPFKTKEKRYRIASTFKDAIDREYFD